MELRRLVDLSVVQRGAIVWCLLFATSLPAGGAPWEATRVLDRAADAVLTIDDLYAQTALPADLDNDGVSGFQDSAYLEAALRWDESRRMAPGR